jgi:DNA-binding SARP family transcriptional activator/ABC-type branched-subunit amino acid transport system substrate-binding protein/streptogramin lyase
VRYGLLGLLEVVEGDEAVSVGRGKESALLAILLLHANEPVSADRLTQELWEDASPPNAIKNIQQYVSRLRRALGSERVATTPGGYSLRVEPGELDTERFALLAAAGTAALESGDASAADRLLSEALELWRGPALADFSYDAFAQDAIRTLESERRSAIADRIDARLALGREERVQPELQQLIEEDPLWERPRGQLMLALYRSGRQSEALELYRETRGLLDRELGLEPSPELQELEREILNQDPSLGAHLRRPPEVRRRRRALALVASAIVAVVAVAVGVLAFGGSATHAIGDNEVAAIDDSGRAPISYTSVGTTPGDVAVGSGAVWVLNADDRTITQLDPKTHRVMQTFAVSGQPTELAMGAGALWVGDARVGRSLIESEADTVDVSRVDPATKQRAGTTHLFGTHGTPSNGPNTGVSLIAVHHGAVSAVDIDGSLTRLDAATGLRRARIRATAATAIAAGDAGVWYLTNLKGTPAVVRVDTRRNMPAQVIRVQTNNLVGIAVGAGSVWATDPLEGVVWRIDPGPKPVLRTIPVGFGVAQIAFGDGAVWSANLANATLSRIDPRTGDVTGTKQLAGTPQGLAVGEGAAWVTVAGGTSTGVLPAPDCSPVESGGRKPDLLVVSDLPLQGPSVAATLADSVRFVLRSRGFRAGKYTVGYQSCDDSTARSQGSEFFKCAANARDYASAEKLVAVIGPYDSTCAQIEIPITNRATSGPLALVSPSNTYTGLTRPGPGGLAGEPVIYYPTGSRSYLRLASPDELQGAAQAVLARQLERRRMFVLSDGSEYGDILGRGFRSAARHLGVPIVGSSGWDPSTDSYSKLVAAVARSRADGVLVAGFNSDAQGVIHALRTRFGEHLVLIGGDGFLTIPDTLRIVGPAAVGMYVSLPNVVAESLSPAARQLLASFETAHPSGASLSGTYLPEMLEAALVVVDAIARSDGTRASVLQQLRAARMTGGLLGAFHFDANGDMTPSPFAILRITGSPRGSGLAADFRGSVVERTVRVPVSLLGRAG